MVGPRVITIMADAGGRQMPAGTPALLELVSSQTYYAKAVWEKHYQHHADAEDHGWD